MPLIFNESNVDYKAIIHENRLVAIVSKQYRLLPNEEAVKIADAASKLAGLVPFDQFNGDWFKRLQNHVICDREKHRVHALYASNTPFYVQGEKMHVGVGVHNSIDASMGFGCGVFTFRHACSNMVFAGMRGYAQEFDQRRTLDCIYARHTQGLGKLIENLKTVILGVMEKANLLIETYNRMATEKAEEELLEKIRRSRLPKKILPDYLDENAVEPVGLTKWELYNDLTAAIWHNAKTDLKSKDFQFDVLHAVLEVK
jgi:hypothetical protein